MLTYEAEFTGEKQAKLLKMDDWEIIDGNLTTDQMEALAFNYSMIQIIYYL